MAKKVKVNKDLVGCHITVEGVEYEIIHANVKENKYSLMNFQSATYLPAEEVTEYSDIQEVEDNWFPDTKVLEKNQYYKMRGSNSKELIRPLTIGKEKVTVDLINTETGEVIKWSFDKENSIMYDQVDIDCDYPSTRKVKVKSEEIEC